MSDSVPHPSDKRWVEPTPGQTLSFLQQAHDKTLLSINNHLVNGKGNELDGLAPGAGVSEERLKVLKEEILRELERRVSLSCSSCQVVVTACSLQQIWSFTTDIYSQLSVCRMAWKICAGSSGTIARGSVLWRSS